MAIDVSGELGSPQLAGVQVSPLGMAARQVSVRGGGGAGIMVTDAPRPGPSQTPAFGRAAYLAVTGQELALVGLQGSVTLRPAEVVARVPRDQVQTADLSPGWVAPLTVTFTDGSIWRLEVSPFSKSRAKAVVGALGGRRLTRSDLPSQPLPPMSGFRMACGILWAALAVIFVAGGFGELSIHIVPGAVLVFFLGACSAWYDYRIWTRKAKRLLLIF